MSSQCATLNNALKTQGRTFADLARETGYSENRVQHICEGKEKPTQEEIQKLAQALNLANPPTHNVA